MREGLHRGFTTVEKTELWHNNARLLFLHDSQVDRDK